MFNNPLITHRYTAYQGVPSPGENANLYPLLSTVKTKANERQNNKASHECLKKRIKNLLADICFLDPKEMFPCEFGSNWITQKNVGK